MYLLAATNMKGISLLYPQQLGQSNGCTQKWLSLDLNSRVSNIVTSMKGSPLPRRLWSFFHWSSVTTNQTGCK